MDVNKINKTYEDNDIKLRGIVGFGLFLLGLILLTFFLMWILQYKILEPQFAETVSPMAMKPTDKLPPEPRLQSAPGFGVDGKDGRINLELREPQAEYKEQLKIWNNLEANGQKDAKTGTVVVMPMKDAKAKLIEKGLQSRSPEESEKATNDAKNIYSNASGGRMATEIRK